MGQSLKEYNQISIDSKNSSIVNPANQDSYFFSGGDEAVAVPNQNVLKANKMWKLTNDKQIKGVANKKKKALGKREVTTF